TESPSDAHWLRDDERAWLTAEMATEEQAADGAHNTLLEALRSRRLWTLAVLYFCLVIAFYGVTFWLPQIGQAAGASSSARVVLLSAIPAVASAIGMIAIGSHSDRTGERRWHVAIPALVGATGFVATVMLPATVFTSLATLSIAAFGIWGALG